MALLGRPPKLVSLHITVWSTEKIKLERLAKNDRLSLSAYLRRKIGKLLDKPERSKAGKFTRQKSKRKVFPLNHNKGR